MYVFIGSTVFRVRFARHVFFSRTEKQKSPAHRQGFFAASSAWLCGGNDADGSFPVRALDCELDSAWDECEQSVIFADADVDTGMNLRAALANDNAARIDHFAAVSFYAQTLRVRVATVA
jgi:hypothetical protein